MQLLIGTFVGVKLMPYTDGLISVLSVLLMYCGFTAEAASHTAGVLVSLCTCAVPTVACWVMKKLL